MTQPTLGVLDGSGNPQTINTINPNGSATSANSQPVVIASDQAAVPVSVAALPLPTGAATGAAQTTLQASATSIDGKLTGVATAANQATGNTSLSSMDGKTPALGNAATAASRPVTLATDTATGSLGALNATVVVPSASDGTTMVQLTGTWVGTVTFEGSNDNFATSQAIVAVQLAAPGALASTATGNGFYSVLSAGFKKVQARMSAYTSGSATVAADSCAATRVIVPVQGIAANHQMTATQGPAGAAAWKTDGSATTQPVSVADGSSVTQGAKADAAANNSTSSWSLVALLKGIYQNTIGRASGQAAAASSLSMVTATDDSNVGPSITGAVGGPQSATGDIIAETDVSAYAGCYLDISGITTATIQFFGGNFTGALKSLGTCQPTDTPTISPPVSSVTANKMLWIPFGFKYFRVNVSAWTSGAITVRPQYVLKGTPVPYVQMQSITPSPTVSVGPATFFRNQNAATTGSPTNIKSTAAVLCALVVNNANASTDLYVQLYNKGSTPVVGTDTPNMTLRVKAGTNFSMDVGPFGIRFSNGLGISFTSDFAGATGVTTAADGTATGAYA